MWSTDAGTALRVVEPYTRGARVKRWRPRSGALRAATELLAALPVVKRIRDAVYTGKVDYNTLEESFLVASVSILLAG